MPGIAGVTATVKWEHLTAAEIHGFTITRDERRQMHATGTLATVNAVAVQQAGLIFVVPNEFGPWRFPILDPLPTKPGPFAVRLGPRLEK
jgi:hypothetical protein